MSGETRNFRKRFSSDGDIEPALKWFGEHGFISRQLGDVRYIWSLEFVNIMKNRLFLVFFGIFIATAISFCIYEAVMTKSADSWYFLAIIMLGGYLGSWHWEMIRHPRTMMVFRYNNDGKQGLLAIRPKLSGNVYTLSVYRLVADDEMVREFLINKAQEEVREYISDNKQWVAECVIPILMPKDRGLESRRARRSTPDRYLLFEFAAGRDLVEHSFFRPAVFRFLNFFAVTLIISGGIFILVGSVNGEIGLAIVGCALTIAGGLGRFAERMERRAYASTAGLKGGDLLYLDGTKELREYAWALTGFVVFVSAFLIVFAILQNHGDASSLDELSKSTVGPLGAILTFVTISTFSRVLGAGRVSVEKMRLLVRERRTHEMSPEDRFI